jgi:hypothetical protein
VAAPGGGCNWGAGGEAVRAGAGLWLFTRDPLDAAGHTATMLRVLADKGIDTSALLPVEQRGCTYEGASARPESPLSAVLGSTYGSKEVIPPVFGNLPPGGFAGPVGTGGGAGVPFGVPGGAPFGGASIGGAAFAGAPSGAPSSGAPFSTAG